MAKTIKTIRKAGSRSVPLSITVYYGGKRGVCYQLTSVEEDGRYGYVQLTISDVLKVIRVIAKDITQHERCGKKGAVFHEILDALERMKH